MNLRKIMIAGILALPMAGGSVALAQDVNCANPTDQFSLNVCSQRTYEATDRELNAAWTKARAAAKRADADVPDYLGKGEAADSMLQAQRGWIEYRNGQCALEASEVLGGTMLPMVRTMCLARMTKTRTEELQQYYSQQP